MLREGKRLIDGSGTVPYSDSSKLLESVELETTRFTSLMERRLIKCMKNLQTLRLDDKKRACLLEGSTFFINHQNLYQLGLSPFNNLRIEATDPLSKNYWDIKFKPEYGVAIEFDLNCNLKVICTPIQKLSLSIIASVVDIDASLACNDSSLYENEDTILERVGLSCSKKDRKDKKSLQLRYRQQLEAELLLAMMHSFRDDYLVALVIASHQGKKYIVGSMGAMRGSGEKSLRETKIEAGAPQIHPSLLSSLPTQAALSFAYNQDGEELADLPESSLAEITRLNVVSADLLKQVASEADRATVSASLMMIIHEGIARNWPDVSHEIFNTQPALHRVLRKHGLPVKIISEPNSIQPTTVVGETIHGVYFKKKPPIPQSLSVAAACVVAEQFFQQLSNNQ